MKLRPAISLHVIFLAAIMASSCDEGAMTLAQTPKAIFIIVDGRIGLDVIVMP